MNIPQEFVDKANEWANRTGADPLLLLAIARHETNFGTLGAGRQGYALGYGVYSPNNIDGRFQGLDNQLHYAGAQIFRYMQGRPVTQELLEAFGRDSWKAGDTNWADKVWIWYCTIKGQPATPPAPQPQGQSEVWKTVQANGGLWVHSKRDVTAATRIGKLDNGVKVRVGWTDGDWTNIYYGQHGGFVASQYLK